MSALEELNKYLEKQTTFLNYVEGHPLVRCSENIKNVYITLLNLILKDQEPIDEKQQAFLERLTKSIELDNPVVDQVIDASEKNFINTVGEVFIKYFRHSELKYNFVLDLLLLLMQANTVQKQCITLICLNLGLKEAEINFLMQLATCILDEDSESYMQLIEKAPREIKVQNFSCYVKTFLVGRMVDDETSVIYYSNPDLYHKPSFNEVFKNEEMSMERWVFKQDILVFENWQIDLTYKNWQFKNNQKVIFKNCEIIGDKYPICFDGVSEITIDNCTFTYFNNRVLLISDCIKLNVEGCTFKECMYLYDMYQNSNGGVYFIADKAVTVTNELREVRIVNSQFIECSVWNKEGHYYSDYSLGYSMNIPQEITNCSFKNCLSYMGMPKRLCQSGSVLFNQGIVQDCTVIASHNIL